MSGHGNEQMMRLVRAMVGGVAATFLAVALAACGGDSDSTGAGGTSSSSVDAAVAEPLTAVGATKVEYDDTTLRAYFEGSVEDATAWIYCSSLEMVTPDADERFVVYPDGELDCAKRYDD